MKRDLITIFTFMLFLNGVLVLIATMLNQGIGYITLFLTFCTLIGIIALQITSTLGLKIIFFVSIGWILKNIEYVIFFINFKTQNVDKWVFIITPILLSIVILILICNILQDIQENAISIKKTTLLILVTYTIYFMLYVNKQKFNKFNFCYYFDNNNQNFRSKSENIFETKSDSKELKIFVLKYGTKDQNTLGKFSFFKTLFVNNLHLAVCVKDSV